MFQSVWYTDWYHKAIKSEALPQRLLWLAVTHTNIDTYCMNTNPQQIYKLYSTMHTPKSKQFSFYSLISEICLMGLYICAAYLSLDPRCEKQLLTKQLIKGDGGYVHIEISMDQKRRRVTDNRCYPRQKYTCLHIKALDTRCWDIIWPQAMPGKNCSGYTFWTLAFALN